MIKAVIFDLDGTAADTLDDLTSAMNTMLVHFGYPKRSREEIRSFLGFGQTVFVTESLPEYARSEENVRKCARYYDAYYASHSVVLTRAFDGISEILEKLREKGIKTAIFSNKNQNHLDAIVGKIIDTSLLDAVLGAGEVKHKPDPEGVLILAEKFGVSPSECVLVGDTEIDILTAKNSSARAVGVTWGFRSREQLENCGAADIADNAKELAEILGL